MTNGIDGTEKRVMAAAAAFVVAGLALIAYATFGLGINVATCVPADKAFDQPGIVRHEGHNYEVHYVARMWGFAPTVLRVPTGSTLDIYAISKDVTHGFELAGTNVNLMVVPGVVANNQVRFSRPGTYMVVCHEYCGAGHQNMSARIEVSDSYTDISAEGLGGEAGAKLLEASGCTACHSTDGSVGVGPTFKGAWGSTLTMADGSHRVLDAAFVADKVAHPTTVVVAGYPPVMPVLPLTADQIAQIAQYLETLK